MVNEVTTKEFRAEVLQSEDPVVVDFYADWCAPCRQLAPEIEALSDEYDGRVRFAKLNVDLAADLAQRYGVSSIPSVLLFEDGEVKARSVGAKPGAVLATELGLGSADLPDHNSGIGCAC